jgi:AraC-like DNA-binding protein
MNLHIRHVVVCRHAQETAYVVQCPTIGFTFSGQEFSEYPGLRTGAGATGLFLYPQGLPIHFRFNERRENYAVLFDSDDIRTSTAAGRVEIRHGEEWFAVPLFVPVEAGRLEGWRVELERIRLASLMPTARNRLHAEIGVLNMIRYMAEESAPAVVLSPAGRLKSLIDADPAGARSMKALCAECGYSPDYLRLLFMKEFGVTPKPYRIRRRMAEAMEWITGSGLSVKEMAWRLGFSQVSHFSAVFKAVHGMSPREAMCRFRGPEGRAPPLLPRDTRSLRRYYATYSSCR